MNRGLPLILLTICAVDTAWLTVALTSIGIRRLVAARRFRRHLRALQLLAAASLARLVGEDAP